MTTLTTTSSNRRHLLSAEELEFIEKYLYSSAENQDIDFGDRRVFVTQLEQGKAYRKKGELALANSFFKLAMQLLLTAFTSMARPYKQFQLIQQEVEELQELNHKISGQMIELIVETNLKAMEENRNSFETATKYPVSEQLKLIKELVYGFEPKIFSTESFPTPMLVTKQYKVNAAPIVHDFFLEKKDKTISPVEILDTVREAIHNNYEKISPLELSHLLLQMKMSFQYSLPCLVIPKEYGLNDATVAKALRMSTSTFNRIKSSEKDRVVTDERAEKVILLIYLLERGIEIFNSKKLMTMWLTTPNEALDDIKPVDYMSTVGKFMEAITLLERFEEGVYR